MDDNEWEIPYELLDEHMHLIEIQSEGIDGGISLRSTTEVAVNPIEEVVAVDANQDMTKGTKGKEVPQPKILKKKKLVVKKYRTRSKTTFKSTFFGNDKDPINLD